MSDGPTEMDVMAYVDDQLDIGQRFAVETYLSHHPAQAAEVMGELSTRTGLRLLADDPAPVPHAMIGRTRRRGRAMVVGGLSLIAATIVALLILPGRPPAYVDMAVASHRVAMMRAQIASQIEAPTLDAGEILASTQIVLPALPSDWRVTDAQLFPTSHGPALLVAVQRPNGQQLSLFALRQRSGAPEIPDAVREGLESVAYWRRGDMSYALTGEDDPVSLDQTAEGLNRSWS